jgi:hypothetical protein
MTWKDSTWDGMILEFRNARLYYNAQMIALGEKHKISEEWIR